MSDVAVEKQIVWKTLTRDMLGRKGTEYEEACDVIAWIWEDLAGNA